MQAYAAAVAAGEIRDSALQREVVAALAEISAALARPRSRWYWPFRLKKISGLYIYGPVGAGKTYLMDLFYQHVPIPDKQRYHFHHFMQWVDSELRRLQGLHDPLQEIVRVLASRARVLCLDEFLVHDVAHAMMLADLLQGLLQQGVVLIATANTAPDDLYKNGVNREYFLPAIALIKHDCRIMQLAESCDYRLGRAPSMTAYFSPINALNAQAFAQTFATLVGTQVLQDTQLTIQNRNIRAKKCAQRVVWFDFNVLCNLPRSQLDYLELAQQFAVIFLSDIPALAADDVARVVLLIRLVDVLYDQGLGLIILAAVPAASLYPAGPLLGEFKRTLSRLQEMQAADYLRRHQHCVV